MQILFNKPEGYYKSCLLLIRSLVAKVDRAVCHVIHNDDGTLHLGPGAVPVPIPEDVKGPIVVNGVTGPSRKGKSYLLNQELRHARTFTLRIFCRVFWFKTIRGFFNDSHY